MIKADDANLTIIITLLNFHFFLLFLRKLKMPKISFNFDASYQQYEKAESSKTFSNESLQKC